MQCNDTTMPDVAVLVKSTFLLILTSVLGFEVVCSSHGQHAGLRGVVIATESRSNGFRSTSEVWAKKKDVSCIIASAYGG